MFRFPSVSFVNFDDDKLFSRIVDRQKSLSLISSRVYGRRFSQSPTPACRTCAESKLLKWHQNGFKFVEQLTEDLSRLCISRLSLNLVCCCLSAKSFAKRKIDVKGIKTFSQVHHHCRKIDRGNLKIVFIFQLKKPRNFLIERNTLLNKITDIDSSISNQINVTVTQALLFGNLKYSFEVFMKILNPSIEFVLIFKRFD